MSALPTVGWFFFWIGDCLVFCLFACHWGSQKSFYKQHLGQLLTAATVSPKLRIASSVLQSFLLEWSTIFASLRCSATWKKLCTKPEHRSRLPAHNRTVEPSFGAAGWTGRIGSDIWLSRFCIIIGLFLSHTSVCSRLQPLFGKKGIVLRIWKFTWSVWPNLVGLYSLQKVLRWLKLRSRMWRKRWIFRFRNLMEKTTTSTF